MGTTLRFGDEVLSVQPGRPARVQVRRPDGSEYTIEAGFILDASGFARLLPRLLQLESPSNFPVRGAIFCHVRDHIPADAGFDRNKILITTHPEHVDVWYWTIPVLQRLLLAGRGRRTELLREVFRHRPGKAAAPSSARTPT